MNFKYLKATVALSLCLMMFIPPVDARGFRGGGYRGGGYRGGAYRGGGYRGSAYRNRSYRNNAYRNRAYRGGGFGGRINRSNFGGGFNSIARTNTPRLNNRINYGGARPATRPAYGNRPVNRPAYGNRPINRPGYGSRPVGGWGNIGHPNRGVATRPINNQNFHRQANAVRGSFNNINVNRYGGGFHGGYGGWHGGGYGYGRWGWGHWYGGWPAAYAFTSLGVRTLTSFLGLGLLYSATKNSSQPQVAPSDYGKTVIYQGDTVYMNGQPTQSAENYYNGASQLASNGKQEQEESEPTEEKIGKDKKEEWKPLGVFSLVQGKQTESTMVFQLAINKDGVVRGNYKNQITNETSEIYGSLDKKTQRISWTVGNNPQTVFDTSFTNITKDESPILVHYGPKNTEQMALVRQNAPENSGNKQQTG